MGGAGNVLNFATNLDPTLALIGQQQQQLSTVCTQQLAFDQVTAATFAAAAGSSGSSSGQSSGHAPLNATNTMKPSAGNSSPSPAAAAASPRKATVSNISGNS